MSAFLRKRAEMSAQTHDGESIDLTGSQCSLVNKPFKPPTRDNSKISEISDPDEFDDKEFERDLKELGDIDGELLMDQAPMSVQAPSWTPINKQKTGIIDRGIPKHHGTEDDMIPPPSREEDDAGEAPEPAQRDDGKWDCNHRCSDKTSCRHLCCREGLDHKPKPKRKPPVKASTKRPESSQAKLTPHEGHSNAKPQQKQVPREFPQTKPAKTASRKRVSDLINDAADSVVEVIDLSKDDEVSFKGNGAGSIRKLNELHTKSQMNKSSIKLPKLSRPTPSYKPTEKPDISKSNTDELEQLLADDDDDDFPSISGIIEEARMKEESDRRNKEKEDDYGLDDSLLDSLDAYVVDDLEKSIRADKEIISIYDIPENTPPKDNMKKLKRKISNLENSELVGDEKKDEALTKDSQCEGTINTQEIPSETVPSSPPPKILDRETLASPIPPRPFKKVRFEDNILEDISDKPSSRQNAQSISGEEPQKSNRDDRNKGVFEENMAVNILETSIEAEDEKENTVEQELMDFFGDCVVFVD
ncbi:hypothetical protein AA313_de0203306 [Arthrobotrys entomopaga]|nr:hypothetical protein AA313_de0203306 [Arthrobotrys entomopaga]